MGHGGARPGGGRPKGSVNKATADVMAKLKALGCDPFTGMAKLASGLFPCPPCNETGVLANGEACPACAGAGVQPVPLKIIGDMNAELAQYVAPKRKAVEMSIPDGIDVRAEFVDRPPRQTREEWLAARERELGSVVAPAGAATGRDRV